MSETRVSPHNLEAERSVLGAILIEPEVFSVAAAHVDASAFFRKAHALAFDAITALVDRKEAIDIVTLVHELERAGNLEACGGPAYIAALTDGVPRSTNVKDYARIISEDAARRSLILHANRIIEHAYVGERPVADIVLAATEHLSQIGEGRKRHHGTPVIVTIADVAPEAIRWLWPGRLAFGKLTVIAGNPGLGKSIISLDAGARASAGRSWPGGSPGIGAINVLAIVAEDGIADTIRPRLDNAGADVSRVHVLKAIRIGRSDRAVQLADVDGIEAAIEKTGARLVIIDPLSAYLGDTDSHRDADVRGLMTPIVELAERKDAAILAVMHLSKTAGRSAIHRASGSVAFVAQSRFALAVIVDPDNRERRYLAPMKCNLTKEPDTLAFGIPDGRLTWEAEPVSNFNLDATLAASEGTQRDKSEQTDVDRVLQDLLDDVTAWPMPAKDALAAGEARGIHPQTLRRAAMKRQITIKRDGFGRGGKWLWHRPIGIDDTLDSNSLNAKELESMESMEDTAEKLQTGTIDNTKSSFPRARGNSHVRI